MQDDRVGIDNTSISTKVLLEQIRENRDQHIKDYEEAMVGYREAIGDYLRGMRELADTLLSRADDLERANAFEDEKVYQDFAFRSPKPQNHASQYDRVIKRLEMTVETEIVLNQYEFAQYVCDDWDWKGDFLRTSSLYAAGASKK